MLFSRKVLAAMASIGLLHMEQALAASAPTVTLASGVIVGKTTTVTSGTATTSNVVNYLGIPFAAVPTGSLRFAPPVPASSRSSPVMATSLPPACLQQFVGGPVAGKNAQIALNNPGHPPPSESEDCLYLNVFAPTSASPQQKKPVLFWLFGGGFQIGTGSLNYYNGSSFAAFQDVMVVTINYRNNIFGFSGSPELPMGKQNAGLLDQRLALQWVQDNIEKFGGDPKRVTIFGQSSGAISVKQLLANPPSPLPFSSAILESQATSGGAAGGLVGGASFQQVVAYFGCSGAASQLDCLRKVSGIAIQKYINDTSLVFVPAQDNATQTYDVRPSIFSKKFANVPIMIGTNAEEGRLYPGLGGLDPGNSTLIDTVVQFLFPTNKALQSIVKNATVNALLPPFEAASQVITNYLFTCSTSLLSTFLAGSGYPNVWRYYYNATFPNLQVFADLGAFHGSEIPQVFGTYDLTNVLGSATPNQIALSKYMQTTWANFAKNPSQGPEWPRLTGNFFTNQMGELGGRNSTGETTVSVNTVDYQCPLYNAFIALGGY